MPSRAELNRRHFLRTLGLCAAGAALPSVARAQNSATEAHDPEQNFSEPDGLTGEPLALPAWKYGKVSAAPDTMLMFRGNPSHTFYGTGPVPDALSLAWRQPMAKFHTKLRGKSVTWTGTGWTGQPVKLGDYVFAGSQGGYVYAYEAATGAIRWRHKGERMFKGSPCVYENRIYIGNTDDYLRCIDAATGKLVWRRRMGTDCDSSPVVVDGKLYIAGEAGFVRCLDPANGKPHWETEIGGTGPGTMAGSNGSETSPAVADGEVFAATYDGFLYCLDATSGKIKWRVETGDDTDGSAAVVEERVYIAAEEKAPKLYCFDRSQKGKLVWSFANTGGWWSTPAIAGERIYIGGQDGFMYCFDAKTGKEQWRYKAGGPIWSSAAVVGERVIFGCRDPFVYMLDAKTGKFIWKGNMGGRTLSTPIVVDGAIYVGSAGGDFSCFRG